MKQVETRKKNKQFIGLLLFELLLYGRLPQTVLNVMLLFDLITYPKHWRGWLFHQLASPQVPSLAEISEFEARYGVTRNPYAAAQWYAAQSVKHKQAEVTERIWAADDILDTDDILEDKRRMWAIARRAFRSLSSNPHTSMIDIPMGQMMDGMDVPKTAILNILQSAMQGFEKSLTKRQQQAADAYDEAIHLGINPSMHVAAKLGINRHSAYKLIQRANLETFHEIEAYIYRSVYQMDGWSPTPKQITAMMKSKPRTCAYCGGKTYDGSVPLCFECHSRLGSLREEAWDKRTRSWLKPEIDRIRREHKAWAVDQCYLVHCGVVPIEQYEFLMTG